MLSEYIISCLDIYYVVNIFFFKNILCRQFMLLVCIEVCCVVVVVACTCFDCCFIFFEDFSTFSISGFFLCLISETNFFFEKFIFQDFLSNLFCFCQRLLLDVCVEVPSLLLLLWVNSWSWKYLEMSFMIFDIIFNICILLLVAIFWTMCFLL